MADSGVSIVKAHAYGNDFLLIRDTEIGERDPAAFARLVCDRHTGVGADGLILFHETAGGAAVRLINSDGGPAEVSGNGVRCLAAWLVRGTSVAARDTREIRIETDAGPKTLTWLESSHDRHLFCAAMGRPTDVREVQLSAAGETLTAVTLMMGNPQCVVLGPLRDVARFRRLGPAIERHEMFPAGTNVEFAEVISPDLVRILIWERGAGPTLSSGTGSCAAAVVASLFGGAHRDVEVSSPGGSQRVEWREDGVVLTGWAQVVLQGVWVAELS